MTLLLRCVSAGIELPGHLGHAYIISNALYTGCTAVVGGSTKAVPIYILNTYAGHMNSG